MQRIFTNGNRPKDWDYLVGTGLGNWRFPSNRSPRSKGDFYTGDTYREESDFTLEQVVGYCFTEITHLNLPEHLHVMKGL